MKKTLLAGLSIGLLLNFGVSQAATINLTGTIRDFSSSHPDFGSSAESVGSLGRRQVSKGMI